MDHEKKAPGEVEFHNTGLYNIDGRGAYPAPNTGVHAVTGNPIDMGRFKAPTLRNIALTAPYMHDGSIRTLEEVLTHYEAGGRTIADGPNKGVGATSPRRSALVKGFTLTAGRAPGSPRFSAEPDRRSRSQQIRRSPIPGSLAPVRVSAPRPTWSTVFGASKTLWGGWPAKGQTLMNRLWMTVCRIGVQRTLVAVLTAFSFAWPAEAQDVPHLSAGQLADGVRPEIDGHVDDEVWKSVTPFSTFIQQEPNEGQPSTERTEVRFLIDRRNLYIGIVNYDSEPDKIVVSQSRRDSELTDTDSVQILLDTYNDGQNAFVFGTNPFGIEYDGQVMGEGPDQRLERPRRRRRFSDGAGLWLQCQLGRGLDRAGEHDRARLGGGVRHPAEDRAVRARRGPNVGRERHAQHPAEERAVVPVARAARLHAASRVGGRQAR